MKKTTKPYEKKQLNQNVGLRSEQRVFKRKCKLLMKSCEGSTAAPAPVFFLLLWFKKTKKKPHKKQKKTRTLVYKATYLLKKELFDFYL